MPHPHPIAFTRPGPAPWAKVSHQPFPLAAVVAPLPRTLLAGGLPRRRLQGARALVYRQPWAARSPARGQPQRGGDGAP